MNMKTEKIVMMDSDEAASIQTVTGWVDRQGRFWGKDEHQARWCGATHRKCKNKPEEHPIHSTHGYCEECHRENRQAKFATFERAVWAGEPLVIFDGDQYFFDIESLADHCLENSVDAPRDKCAHFREINGIAAAFQHLQKNYIPAALSFL